jgi:hypothetical protein
MKLESGPRISEVTIIALKKPKAAKCSEHCAISLTAHATKTVMRILGRSIEKNIKGVIGKDQFGCRRCIAASDATGMLRRISEQSSDI